MNPKIFITTSRYPSAGIIKFVLELKKTFPNSKKLPRGRKFLKSLVEYCINEGGTDLILIHEYRGEPDAIILSHLPEGPSVYFTIKRILFLTKKTKINFTSLSPHIVIDNLNSEIGKRFVKILCSLFSSPKPNSNRIVSLSGEKNYIVFRHFLFQKREISEKSSILHELGPSFEMLPFKIVLGNLGDKNQKIEWKFSSFIKSHSKKSFLYKSKKK